MMKDDQAAVPAVSEETYLTRTERSLVDRSIRNRPVDSRYLLLVEKLRQIKSAVGGCAIFGFTSVNPQEGVTYVSTALAGELGRVTGERVLLTKSTTLFDEGELMSRRLEESSWRPTRDHRGWREQSEDQRQFDLSGVRTRFDYVLIDIPSMKTSADALLLGRYLDGLCLVVGAGETKRTQIERAVSDLSMSGAEVVGFVLNKRTYPLPDFIYKRL